GWRNYRRRITIDHRSRGGLDVERCCQDSAKCAGWIWRWEHAVGRRWSDHVVGGRSGTCCLPGPDGSFVREWYYGIDLKARCCASSWERQSAHRMVSFREICPTNDVRQDTLVLAVNKSGD